ncbi:hypothetical protein [Pseudomonas phage pPA-3099-2aT.2]|uniref:Uncharacterized protein n=2 Tax=Skurskavirinae TaxID=3152223 RepID=A0AAE9KU95_9CAUD|nr:hypothetical protein QE320_gp093 [Pseudomonas phage EM]YP_010762660.1 hypothetical protein QE325_gp107 [Pseudomonas phage pPA-3099-2aT.2]UPW35961.1 hypothetical protein EM_176 [Pseudomonas phage EM]WBQ35274.1 hypothetical protein [Pseudomonas phage pPA-3099-2aT.2]
MIPALARLQNERWTLIHKMLCSQWRSFHFEGHPWAERVRGLHDEANCIREHFRK